MGFTIAEGSFGVKGKGEAFFQIKQKGIENYNLIKAICAPPVGGEPNIKPDYSNSYQLTLSSKADVQKVFNFFSASDTNLPATRVNLLNITNDLFILKRVKDIKTLYHTNPYSYYKLNFLYKFEYSRLKCRIVGFFVYLNLVYGRLIVTSFYIVIMCIKILFFSL